MFPFHTWLPDAHRGADGGLGDPGRRCMLKLGAYGFLRFAVPLFPDAAADFAPAIVVAVADRDHLRRDRRARPARPQAARGVLVGQPHGLRDARASSCSPSRAQGAILQMINHGLITGPCSCSSASSTSGPMTGRSPRWAVWRGTRSTRRSSASSFRLGRLARAVRASSASSSSWSGTFVGKPGRGRDRGFVMVLAAGYLLFMYQRVIFGEVFVPREPRPPPDRHRPDRDPDAGSARHAGRRLRLQPGLLLDLIQGTRRQVHGLRHGQTCADHDPGAIVVGADRSCSSRRPHRLRPLGRQREPPCAHGGARIEPPTSSRSRRCIAAVLTAAAC